MRAIQETLGSRAQMAKMETIGQPRAELDDNLMQFIRARTSIYLGTASKDGEPYVQHRGGEEGFIQIVDNKTLAIPEYPGNRQYITFGNLSENPRAFIFMIDYELKARVKFWGNASVENLAEDHRSLVFNIEAWDLNCSKYLPDFFTMKTIRQTTGKLTARIEELEAEVQRLKTELGEK